MIRRPRGERRLPMINFPLPILAKAITKNGRINLRAMLFEAMKAHIGFQLCHDCAKVAPDNSAIYLRDFSQSLLDRILVAAFSLSDKTWEESAGFCPTTPAMVKIITDMKKVHEKYTKKSRPPYCSMSLDVWLNYMDHADDKTEFEIITLLAAMAIRSIVGPEQFKPIVWEYILSRMAGNIRKVDVAELPPLIQQYDQQKHRKKKDKLLKELQYYWGVQYIFKGRKPWYCTDCEMELSNLIATYDKHFPPKCKRFLPPTTSNTQ